MARLHKHCWLFQDVGWVRAVGAITEIRLMQADNIASPCHSICEAIFFSIGMTTLM